MSFEQVRIESVDQGFARALGRKIELELLENRREKNRPRNLRIQDQRDVGLIGQLLEQCANESRLAGADLARELNEAAAMGHPVDEMCERIGVALAQKEIARIGRDRERFLAQAEELRVHNLASVVSANARQVLARVRVILRS